MVKVLIVRWIILNCDRETFIGMRWHDRGKGIFWLYWRHQSSRSCKDNTDGSSALYEYYRAWARHKNNNRRRQPRDLKAAFRNALEKKTELVRLKDLDTKERIYWQIENFPNCQNESCAPPQPPVKKPKTRSSRGKKSSNNLVENSTEFPVNFGASTSTPGEDVTPEQNKSRKPSMKESKRKAGKAQKTFVNEEALFGPYEPAINGFSESHEVVRNQPQLPSFVYFKRNKNDTGSWDDSVKNTDLNFSTQPPPYLETSYEKQKEEELWTPPFFPHTSTLFPQTPPQLSSDLMEVSSTEMMDLLIPNQRINYSYQPTPPQEATDILFDNFTDADLMTLRNLVNEAEPTILKYSFPFQPEAVPTSPSPLTNTHPTSSAHCFPLDFISNASNNNCVSDSQSTSLNAFLIDKKQCSYDQVVPPYSEAFQTSKRLIGVSETSVNDCFLYSPQPAPSRGQILEDLCHQQADTGCNSVELFRYNPQTSHDDSGFGDMDFWDSTDKLLDVIDSQSRGQFHQMC